MNDSEDEKILEPNEPQISSHIPEERIAARELRIQRRQNAIKRYSAPRGDAPESEAAADVVYDEEISPVEKQAAECAALLEHLLADGEEKVTNVRVASDAREVARRFAEADKKKEILVKLEKEANLAQEKFEIISNNWNPILDMNDPIDIDKEITLQKERCNDLIMQKTTLIMQLKDEMRLVDETFYRDLEKQLKDIKELSERIDAQVLLMRSAYQTQLSLIETSIDMERALTIEYNHKRWEALYKKRDKEEMANIEKKMEQVAEFERRMDILTLEHREKYRAAKIQLETEIQTLQQELQQLKATCIINSEKIDYNFQVLKKREEENVFVRSQQKRKLNKMQDIINALKRKIQNGQKEGAAEEAKANKEICRLHDVMLDLQVKAEHFAHVNERKYQQLWRMNKEKANDLIENIINIDQTINEKILGVESPPIKIKLLKQSDLPSYKRSLERIQNIDAFSCGTESSYTESESVTSSPENMYNQSRNKLVNHILNLVADSSGFLIEERLWPLLQKYENEPVTVCKLDNIFNALEILHEDDIQMLCTFFAKYTYCPECEENVNPHKTKKHKLAELLETEVDELNMVTGNQQDESSLDEESKGDHIKDPRKAQEISQKPVTELPLKITKSEQLLVNEVEEILKDCSTMQDAPVHVLTAIGDFSPAIDTEITRRRMQVTCKSGHGLKVSSVHVLNALQEFVASVVAADKAAKRPILSKVDTAISRSLTSEDVVLFWSKYKEVFSPQKDKLWEGLLFGLNKYHPILQERQKLNEEVIQLRKQNSELQHLLRGHIPSNEIPKTKFLSPINKPIKATVTK